MKVKLDIAGMYFGTEVDVPTGSTIKTVMDAAMEKTKNNAGTNEATFMYQSEPNTSAVGFLNTITVIHRGNSAKSRQKTIDPATGNPDDTRTRTYPNGVYSFADDNFLPGRAGQPLHPLDANKAFVSAWQYYVYDETGGDLARKPGTTPRTIVPYTEVVVKENYTVVWRLVTIFVRSTHGDAGEISKKYTETTTKIM